jgi:hypothetical protein
MHEHAFGLVVGVVAHGDALGPSLLSHLSQESVAGATGRLLQRELFLPGQSGHVTGPDGTGQSPLLSQPGHESSVSIRFTGTYPVVQMSYVQFDAVLAAQAVQDVQQTQRIGAAGDADDHRFFRGQQTIPVNCVTNY